MEEAHDVTAAAVSSGSSDDIVAVATAKARTARTVMEAFENSAQALRQYGVERIRIRGLSQDCLSVASEGSDRDDHGNREEDGAETIGEDGVRIISEQQFMREFVFHSRPCIILGAVEEWPAMQKWREDRYLFDLDHHLPSEEEVSSSSGDDEEEEDQGETSTGQSKEEDAPRHRGPKRITVALTPNGRADAVTHVLYDTTDVPVEARDDVFSGKQASGDAVLLSHHESCRDGETMNGADASQTLRGEKLFMYAAEVKVSLPELYTLLQQSPLAPLPTPESIDMRAYKSAEHGPVVAYAQMQNNCLNTEYQHLHADIQRNVEKFGTRIFGGSPEAANVWFGVPTSVSSFHQDWVENLYPVMRGVKEFTLLPPWEGVYVPKPEIPSAGFELDEDRSDRAALRFFFKPYPAKDGTLVPWMDVDFTPEQAESENGADAVRAALCETIRDNESRKFKRLGIDVTEQALAAKMPKEVHPLVAHVHPGETLYLPSMWLHRVSQRADEVDIRARAKHKINAAKQRSRGEGDRVVEHAPPPPLPLIAAVNYWYDMSFTNPAVVMLREFGLLL